MNVKELDKKYVAGTYGRFDLQLVSGKGAIIKDEKGKEYIDLCSGIAVNIFGIGDEEWKKAVIKQLDTLQHVSNLYYTEPCAVLAEMLCERTGMSKVFFANSGAESNECAIKAARRYAFLKHGDEEHSTIITLKNSFHGRTLAALTATGQDGYHKEFGPFPAGFEYASATDISEMEELAKKGNCTAVMIESVQGEGGVCELSKEFVEGVKRVVKENDLLLICDEVQTGNGRTGKLYGYMNYDLKPDIVTTAKGIGGGLPLGCCMLGEKVKDAFAPGTHGSTFGGNPVACAGAISILSRIDDKLMDGVNEKSAYIRKELEGAPGVKSVTGMGLMLGIEIDKPVKDVINQCMEKGVLILSAKDKIRLLPPLNIEMADLKKAIAVIKEVLA